ncbi:TniQ family protein [Nesterenkonia sp. CF4.4]|uniref:TniQ family protein n=1 Tax=Nesterenkonia sp. CF4.4 TaxID=3373079 RepID=UPI003EE5981A
MPPKPAAGRPERPSAGRPRTRESPGGPDVDAWPFKVTLRPGETLIGWWVRLAHRYGVTPGGLFREFSLGSNPHSPSGVDDMLSSSRQALSRMTGVSDDERRAAADYRRRVQSIQGQVLLPFAGQRRLAPLAGTRFCPLCLKEQQIWRPEWSDPLRVTCLHHNAVLIDHCPSCGKRPFSSAAWIGDGRAPTVCREHREKTNPRPNRHRRRCNTDLAKLLPTPASPELIRAAQIIENSNTDGTLVREYAGLPASPLEAARSLTLLTLEALDVRKGGQIAPSSHMIAEALQKAVAVLDAPSLIAAGRMSDVHGLLPVTGRMAPIGPAATIRSLPLDPILHAIRLQSLHAHLPPTSQLAFQIGSDWPRAPLALRHPHTPAPTYCPTWETPPAAFSAIPQLWWPAAVPGFDLSNDERAQFAISIAGACVGRNITVASAAKRLGAPKASSARITSSWKRLAGLNGWPALRGTILTLADQLVQAPPPIDYESRREKFATNTAFRALMSRGKVHPGVHPPERLWLWCHFTSGGAQWSPAQWGALRMPDVTPQLPRASVIEKTARAVRKHPDEPDQWEPP